MPTLTVPGPGPGVVGARRSTGEKVLEPPSGVESAGYAAAREATA